MLPFLADATKQIVAEYVFAEPRRGDIVNSLADISRLETVLGFVPSSEIEPYLKQMFIHSK